MDTNGLTKDYSQGRVSERDKVNIPPNEINRRHSDDESYVQEKS